MGCKHSTSISDTTSSEFTTLLRSYSEQCRSDPQIQSFDANLQQRTTRVLSSVASCTGSVQSLLEVTGGLLDLNREMVPMLLDARKDIWNSPDLFQLVKEYFDTSIKSLEFCNCLESCLKRARDSQTSIQLELNKFEEESCDQENNFSLTLHELERFKQMGEPFTPEFFEALESVKSKHLEMLEKMLQRKNKLDKKLKSIKSWRKISRLIFVAAFVAVILCSIVVAAVSAPPLVAALANAAMAVPVGSVGTWIDSLFKGYRDAIKGEKEELSDLSLMQSMGISDVNSIKALTENLEIQIKSMLDYTNFALTDNEAMRLGMEEIKRKMGGFTNSVEQLQEKNDQYRQHITWARDLVLTKIINKLTKAD
ncbi:UPF0496 protein 1-like [Carex rostrata]